MEKIKREVEGRSSDLVCFCKVLMSWIFPKLSSEDSDSDSVFLVSALIVHSFCMKAAAGFSRKRNGTSAESVSASCCSALYLVRLAN